MLQISSRKNSQQYLRLTRNFSPSTTPHISEGVQEPGHAKFCVYRMLCNEQHVHTKTKERPAQSNSKICNLVNIEAKRWLDLNPDDEEESWAGQGARGE